MTCVYPLDAWRARKRNPSGKRGLVFNPRDGYTDQKLQVPCGKCVGCTADKARTWGIRMHHEASLHDQNAFITLTYQDPAPENINKRHLQLFFKRLRKYTPVRYFAVGEYGETTHRPHYHAVLFGRDFLEGATHITSDLWTHPVLEQTWTHGQVAAGQVTMASCMYVAGYVNKKANDPDTFNLMSRRPGIGHTWLNQWKDNLVNIEKVVIDGNEYPVPKKYMEWQEESFEPMKNKQRTYLQTLKPEQVIQRRNNLPKRELNIKAKSSLKAHTL